jgi:hypothetical protein
MNCEKNISGLLVILKALQVFPQADETLINHDLNSSTTVRGLINGSRDTANCHREVGSSARQGYA